MIASLPAPEQARIDARILLIRGQKVMIDADLAELYGVPTKALNQAVKRNARRFPPDFMFQLTADEKQQVVTDCDHLAKLKFSKAAPFAFTEHGAIQAGARLRAATRSDRLEQGIGAAAGRPRKHGRTDVSEARHFRAQHARAAQANFDALRELMAPPEAPCKRPIGFVTTDDAPVKPKAAKGKK